MLASCTEAGTTTSSTTRSYAGRSTHGPGRGCSTSEPATGYLAAELASLGHRVTAIDADDPTLRRARARWGADGIDFVLGDFMAHPFAPASFDAIVSIAALHHMPEGDALARMAGLLRPGGTLCVVGLARSRTPVDLLWDLGGAVATRVLRRRRGGYVEVAAPIVWPPPSSYRAIRRLAATALPGVRYRRHVLWRYSLVWTKAAAAPSAI